MFHNLYISVTLDVVLVVSFNFRYCTGIISLLTIIFLNVLLLFQHPGNLKRVMTLVTTVGILSSDNGGDAKVSLAVSQSC